MNTGDFLLADLYNYLKHDDSNTSRISAFFLGLVNAPWKRVKKVTLKWDYIDDSYNYKITILPQIEIEFDQIGT